MEGEISAELLCIWLLFSVEDCAVNDSEYYFMGDGGRCTLVWPEGVH